MAQRQTDGEGAEDYPQALIQRYQVKMQTLMRLIPAPTAALAEVVQGTLSFGALGFGTFGAQLSPMVDSSENPLPLKSQNGTGLPNPVAFYDKAFATKSQVKKPVPSTDFPIAGQVAMDSPDHSLRTLAYQDKPQAGNWVPRPALLIRILWVVLILTLGVLTVFAALMAHLVSGVTARVHEEIRQSVEVVSEPLPEGEMLLDDELFAALLVQRPQRESPCNCAAYGLWWPMRTGCGLRIW